MKLKIRTTAGAALGVAAMAAALSIGCGTLLNLGLPRILIVTGSVFTVMYLTARFCFNLFVRYRIKPIYQVLLSKNVKTHELPPAGDLVEEIQDELNLWAEKNAQEIARLKENERYRKEFLGNVSHEIKTPIFTVQGYILTLLDGGLEDKNINRKYLERSEKSGHRRIPDSGQIFINHSVSHGNCRGVHRKTCTDQQYICKIHSFPLSSASL